MWGFWDLDCSINEVLGMREPLVDVMRRPVVRAAPGDLTDVVWDRPTRSVTVRGEAADPRETFIVFYPARPGDHLETAGQGLVGIHTLPAMGGGRFVAGWTEGGDWELVVTPR